MDGFSGNEEMMFVQRQSTMNSETLDKLLMVEKNLFQADQATREAWKMIGRSPEMGATEGEDGNVGDDSTESVTNRMNLLTTAPSKSTDSQISTTSSASTQIQMEIPRPEGMRPSTRFLPAIPAGHETPAARSIRSTSASEASSSDTSKAMAKARNHEQGQVSGGSGYGKSRSANNIFGFNRDTPPRSEAITMFTFTVKKADSVLEKLGSKKASIQLQVDIENRMLSFLSLNDSRESYSCAAVTARPYSRLGMQLKIQTGNATLNKKMHFYSIEDRMNFMEALEHGKIMCKKINRSLHHCSHLDDQAIPSSEIGRAKIREAILHDHFVPLSGEKILEHVQRVTNLVVMSRSDRAVQGVLKITNYRITFAPYDLSWTFGSFEVPIAAIDCITRDGLMLLISCKDLRTIRLAMHDAYSKKQGYDQMPSTPDIRWLNLLTLRMKPPTQISSLFAFEYFGERLKHRPITSNRKEDGWVLYSPVAEYQRLGFLKGTSSNVNKMKDEPSANNITWRLLKNSKFRFSPTYPQLMVVPSLMTEEQLVQSARFRSRARLPVAVWRHPLNKSVLARSSQPNYGMAGNRSEADRILLRAYRDAANTNSGANVSPPLHIIDARKPIATKGNRLKGKGVENSQHYNNAIIEFMGIANIHKMRGSLDALKQLVSPSSVEDGDKHYHNRLENTRWLKHIMRVLSGARRVAEVLHEDGASVLVHCSDGWDRTPQLVALAQLILDPYYRTIRGFAVLVEKEWCSFGHKFADRIGVGKDVADQPNERSPVMLQFLDCVWQMTRQFPACFEFNEKFLLHIADSLISGLYGTFLYNSERERIFEKVWERTESVWSPILEESTPYKNPLYRVTNRVLYPRANLKRVVLWDAMFFRWDPESHPDYIEFMQPMGGVEVDEIDDESAALGAVQKRIGIEISTETTNDELSTSASQLSTSTSLGSSSLVSTFPGSSVTSPPQMPITTDVNIAIEVEQKALQLDVDVIPDFDDKLKSTMSDCSSISDDEDSTSALASSHSSKNSEGEVEVEKDGHVVSSSSGHEILKESGYVVVDDEFIEKHRRGVEERTRQRSQGRNIREALQMAPNHSRIKYLEQLLSESVARELQLEAELDHVYSRVTSSTQRSIANDRS